MLSCRAVYYSIVSRKQLFSKFINQISGSKHTFDFSIRRMDRHSPLSLGILWNLLSPGKDSHPLIHIENRYIHLN